MKTIIAVDDSMSIRETVRLTLEGRGYRVLSAEDGQRGLELCRAERAQLIITDLNMPRMDGVAMVGHVRSLPQHRFTPILMLTTESQEEKRQAAKKAGATGWVTKPFDPARFLEVVQRLCPATP